MNNAQDFTSNVGGHSFVFDCVYGSAFSTSPTGRLWKCSACGVCDLRPLEGGETNGVGGPYPPWDGKTTCKELLANIASREAERPARELSAIECARLRAKFQRGYYRVWVAGAREPELAYFDGEEVPRWLKTHPDGGPRYGDFLNVRDVDVLYGPRRSERCKCGLRWLESEWAGILDHACEGTDSTQHTRDACLRLAEREDAKRQQSGVKESTLIWSNLKTAVRSAEAVMAGDDIEHKVIAIVRIQVILEIMETALLREKESGD